MALGLLLAFQQIVAQAVEQGDLQRRATAAQVEASWRCKLLRGSSDRDNCPAQAGGAKTPVLLSHALVKPKEK